MNDTPNFAAPGAPDTQRQLQDLRVVLEVARSMAVATDVDQLLALILDAARTVLNADRATLFLYDAQTDELYSKIAQDAVQIRFAADRGIAGAAAQTRRTINIPDAYADPRFNRDVDRQTGYRTRCLLTVPLTGYDDRLVGVVQALNKTEGVFTAYDERLAEALAAQVGVALQRARLLEHYVHKKQMENALALARQIQLSLIPREAPRVPGYDLAGWTRPADETGGDCFDFMPLAGGRLGLTVADATGHGVGPALVIAETRALFRALAGQADRAAEILTRANALLCPDLTEGRFVTAFLGILDPARHLLEYASAGQGPLLWYRAAARELDATASTGLPLGLMDPLLLEAAEPVPFAPGDVGVFLTDGFLEAHDPAGNQFGRERVADVIVRSARLPAAEIIQALTAAVDDFMAGGRQLDDLTAVVVKRCP
jgi:phosphoserine phosphatase